MAMARLAACSAVLLVLFSTLAASTEQPGIVTPLFAWTNSADLLHSRASRDVFPDLRTTLTSILSDALDAPGSAESPLFNLQQVEKERPEVVLVVLGSQMRTSHLRQQKRAAQLSELQRLLDGAASAAVLPHVMHEVQDMGLMAQPSALVDALQGAAANKAKVVECDGVADVASAAEAVAAGEGAGGALVLLVRTRLDQQLLGTPQALQQELAQVKAAHDAVAALDRRQLTLYGVLPEGDAAAPQSRRLAAVQADVGVCGDLCQVQVRWLEGIMALGILTVAAVSGLFCIYVLDTPTRFQLPKERDRQ